MTIIRGLLDTFRQIRGVPPDPHQATAPPTVTRYVPESDLPADVDAEPWRTDPSGEQWYRIEGHGNV